MLLGKINNLGNTIRHICQSSAEDSYLVVFLVNLDPRTVELVLESCSILVFCQNLLNVVSHLGQHRFNWNEQAQTVLLHRWSTSVHPHASAVANVAVCQRG